jgi:DNA replication protein DnaC
MNRFQADIESIQNGSGPLNQTRPARFRDNTAFMQRISAILANIKIVPDDVEAAPITCPDCDGFGCVRLDVPMDDPRWGKLLPCPNPDCPVRAVHREAAYAALLQRAGVPGQYKELTFGTFFELTEAERQGKELAAACCWMFSTNDGQTVNLRQAVGLTRPAEAPRYADLTKNWLVLQGGLGVGKTGLAAAVVNELASRGISAVFFRLQEMMTEIQSRYKSDDDDGEKADDVLSRIQSAPVLILDECNVPGKTASDDKARIMEEIIRFRYARKLPTLLTLNADQDLFKLQWGERTADVVFAASHWVPVGGPRLRRSDTAIKGF